MGGQIPIAGTPVNVNPDHAFLLAFVTRTEAWLRFT